MSKSLFVAITISLLVGCGGTTVAPDDKQNGEQIGHSGDLNEEDGEPQVAETPPGEAVETPEPDTDVDGPSTPTTQILEGSDDGSSTSTTLPSSSTLDDSVSTTTTIPMTTTSVMQLRDFLTAEPDAPGGFTGTVEPDA
ncbi:MAG: hypothetical protein CL458_04380 [Acidimicrobiaceae bacterium]|mgnify:CR=1 FL=1|nr:hypothetical protein [Acidimicrobiaceae bacterium]